MTGSRMLHGILHLQFFVNVLEIISIINLYETYSGAPTIWHHHMHVQ